MQTIRREGSRPNTKAGRATEMISDFNERGGNRHDKALVFALDRLHDLVAEGVDMPVVAKDIARQEFMKHFLAECLEVIAQPEGHGACCKFRDR